MINNPLENQVMEDYDIAYISDQFNEHCFDKGLEISISPYTLLTSEIVSGLQSCLI